MRVQVGAEVFEARAATARPTDRTRLWREMVSIWPEYERYQMKWAREIPVVILERTNGEG